MLTFKIIKIAFSSLITNKMRSFLTMLGVIIGVAAVLTMIAIGRGARSQVEATIERLGTKNLFIRPGAAETRRVARGTVQTLTLKDKGIVDGLRYVVASTAEFTGGAQIKYYNENQLSTVVGTSPEFLIVREYELEKGRFFAKSDIAGLTRVCVLGSEIAKDLFKGFSPLNKQVKINGINFSVIGVMKERGDEGWRNPDKQVYIPITTAQKKLFGVDHLQNLVVLLTDTSLIETARLEITELLKRSHNIPAGKKADFEVRTSTEIIQRWDDMTSAFSILLGCIASISLIVGGIGIMNIMLVTVTERRKEIGIRKAVGAKNSDILKQFILEALVIGIFGGIIGLILGISSSLLVGHFTTWDISITPSSVVLSFGFALVVSGFFGIFPAVKASSQNPIEAIRHE